MTDKEQTLLQQSIDEKMATVRRQVVEKKEKKTLRLSVITVWLIAGMIVLSLLFSILSRL